VVAQLPSQTALYDFSNGTKFTTAVGAFDITLVDGAQSINVTKLDSDLNVARGYIDLTSLLQAADTMTIEFDNTILSSKKVLINIVDLNRRSAHFKANGSGLQSVGVAFNIGAITKTTYSIYNTLVDDYTNFIDVPVHVKIDIDLNNKIISYVVTSDKGVTVSEANVAIMDTSISSVDGIEFFSWGNTGTVATIDNLKIVSRAEAKEKVRYLIANNIGYDEYEYINGEPYKLSGGSKDEETITTGNTYGYLSKLTYGQLSSYTYQQIAEGV